MTELLQSPVVKGAISGLVAALLVDLHAFRSFKTDAEVKAFQWKTAAMRWVSGAIIGAATSLGVGQVA